jgi:hypothetical protein
MPNQKPLLSIHPQFQETMPPGPNWAYYAQNPCANFLIPLHPPTNYHLSSLSVIVSDEGPDGGSDHNSELQANQNVRSYKH